MSKRTISSELRLKLKADFTWEIGEINDRMDAIGFVSDSMYWTPYLRDNGIAITGETKDELRLKFLKDATLAFEGYGFCKEKGYRRCAAVLLSNHRKFKNTYSLLFN